MKKILNPLPTRGVNIKFCCMAFKVFYNMLSTYYFRNICLCTPQDEHYMFKWLEWISQQLTLILESSLWNWYSSFKVRDVYILTHLKARRSSVISEFCDRHRKYCDVHLIPLINSQFSGRGREGNSYSTLR